MNTCNMSPCELTTLVTALANVLSQKLTDEELEIFSAMTVQLGDTLETISAQRSICSSYKECCSNQNNAPSTEL